jgi:hypothetical protein
VLQCRFCSATLDPQTVRAAANRQDQENRIYRKKQYGRHMMIGAPLFVLGLIVTIGSYVAATASEGGGRYFITYGLVIAGAGDFLYGLFGWLGEVRKAN